jgi:hypothetical protein
MFSRCVGMKVKVSIMNSMLFFLLLPVWLLFSWLVVIITYKEIESTYVTDSKPAYDPDMMKKIKWFAVYPKIRTTGLSGFCTSTM